jgi:hypothetical protein
MSTEIEAPLLNTKYYIIFLNKRTKGDKGISTVVDNKHDSHPANPCYFSYIENYFIKNLLNIRKQAAIKLQSHFRSKTKSKLVALAKKRFKICYFLKKIISELKAFASRLQKLYRKKQFRHRVLETLTMVRSNYTILFYKYYEPYQSIVPHSVNIKIISGTEEKLMKFQYNKILKCFLLFLPKEGEYQDHYLFSFIINGNDIIDINFPNELHTDGRYYNVLNMNCLKEKGYLSNVKNSHMHPDITLPRRKLTCPDFINTDTDIHNNHPTIKPILKRGSEKQISPRKKVSFNMNTTYFTRIC